MQLQSKIIKKIIFLSISLTYLAVESQGTVSDD